MPVRPDDLALFAQLHLGILPDGTAGEQTVDDLARRYQVSVERHHLRLGVRHSQIVVDLIRRRGIDARLKQPAFQLTDGNLVPSGQVLDRLLAGAAVGKDAQVELREQREVVGPHAHILTRPLRSAIGFQPGPRIDVDAR